MFLSAKEHAAAFKLDFAPSANYAAAGDGQGVQVAQAGPMGQLGVPLSEPPDSYTAEFRPERPRKRRSFFRTWQKR